MQVAVVIPQFGQSQLTIRCVNSLLKWNRELSQVLIVDDGSHHDEVRGLQRSVLSGTEIVRLATNCGVTCAWNVAARFVDSEIVIFLNNDSETLGSWCGQLVAPLKTGAARLVGAEARTPDEIPQSLRDSLRLQELIAGWCFAIRRVDLNEIGLFDQSLRLYFSDTDLQLRIIEKFGSAAMTVVNDLLVVHRGHQTTQCLPNRNAQWRRDRERFFNKWQTVRTEIDR